MESKISYLMESEKEAERLRIKSDRESTLSQLLSTGIRKLPEDCHVIDAGAGSGFVAKIMGEVMSEAYRRSTLTLLDGSDDRLKVARRDIGDIPNVDAQYVPCDLQFVPLSDGCADYVFSRFVFEYLKKPEIVFTELLRLTKPGGKLVIGDLDYNCMTHYPIHFRLARQLDELVSAISERGILDPYIGRKLYSFFYRHGLADVKVQVIAHHLFYGDLKASDDYNWTSKLEQLLRLSHEREIAVSFDLKKFKDEFMTFLRQPGRFSYTPLIIIEGVKPHGSGQ